MAGSEAEAFLIEQVQAGEEQAWREVIARYHGRLLSFVRRRLADTEAAEDIVQETFLGLLRSLPNYDRNRSLETYLFAIVRHKLTDHFRRRDPGQRESLDALGVDEAPAAWLDAETPSRRLADQEALEQQRGALVAALRQWVEHCRTHGRFQDLIVIEALIVGGQRNKEVAAALELTEQAVAGIKFRVLEQWKKHTQADVNHDWGEADLARDSTVGRIWREEGIACLKRSTLGRFLLGVLEAEWHAYVQFHADTLGCERCAANLDDLRREDERDAAENAAARERMFTSSVGFLSRRPNA